MVLKRKLPSSNINKEASDEASQTVKPDTEVKASKNTGVDFFAEPPEVADVPSDLPPSPIFNEPESTPETSFNEEPKFEKSPDFISSPEKENPEAPSEALIKTGKAKSRQEEFVAPPSFGDEAPAKEDSATSSSLPWETDATKEASPTGETTEWQIDDILQDNNESAAPIGDVYADITEKNDENSPLGNSTNLPPWQQGASSTPPTLPETGVTEKKGIASPLIIVGLIGVILYGGYLFFAKKDYTAEFLARWTGTLQDVSEDLPENIEQAEQGQDNLLKPDEVIDMDQQPETEIVISDDDGEDALSKLIDENSLDSELEPPLANNAKPKSETKVEFININEDEADELITGEKAEEMPKDISVVASMQAAIAKARGKQESDVHKTKDEKELDIEISPEEKARRNAELTQKLENELSAYRKALAGTGGQPQQRIAPGDFFSNPERYDPSIVQPPSVNNSASRQQVKQQIQYGSNPYNLPVIPEPKAEKTPGVRTLGDFNVTMFAPEDPKVRIPKNIKPSFKATDFPEFYILSTVPGRGVIARTDKSEGVLLIGESIEGWELVAVEQNYAEFDNGKRKHNVTFKH